MSVKWGIISTARINRLFLAGARQSSDVEILAVASRTQTSAEEYARAEEIPRAYATYDALLADPDVEAVYIPLPNSLHVGWSIRALEAGKHVLCEKPLSRHPAEIARAFDVAAHQQRLLMEAFMYRHNPQTHRVKELVESGAIGRLRMIRASFSFPLIHEGDVRMELGLDGGGLMDVGCYCVSGARWLAGEPEQVTAQQTLGGAGVDVTLTGTMRFADDVLAHFDCGLALANRHDLEVTGDEGSAVRGRPMALPQTGDPVAPGRRRTTSGSGSSRSIPTGWRRRTCPPRSAARHSPCSAATTRSGRRGRSTRCIARLSAGRRSRSAERSAARRALGAARSGPTERRHRVGRDGALAGGRLGDCVPTVVHKSPRGPGMPVDSPPSRCQSVPSQRRRPADAPAIAASDRATDAPYAPVNAGGRFWPNAITPSMKSLERPSACWSSDSSSS